MKSVFGLTLVILLVLALAGCTLPGAATATPTMQPFPPISSKAPPVNTLVPLPTFTGAAPLKTDPTATKSPTPPVAKSTQLAPTAAPSVQPSATKPAATVTPPPATKAPTAAPTKAPTKAPTTPASSKEPRIFLVALNDNGASGKKIGCGDSVVGVTVQVADPSAPLRGALDKLLAIKTQTYGQSGLYDSLFRSDLRVSSVAINNGVAEIKLSGALTLGGTCDAPRVQAQLEETALQFSTVQKVNITVNGVSLQTLLSQK